MRKKFSESTYNKSMSCQCCKNFWLSALNFYSTCENCRLTPVKHAMSMYKAATNVGDDPEAGVSDANYRWETGYEKTWCVTTD